MSNSIPTSGSDHGPIQFPPTRWSLVLAVRDQPQRAEQALHELCACYRDTIEAWFRMRRPEDAADLAHSFLQRWLGRNRLQNVEQRECSRFRFYLAVALTNFLNEFYRHENAQKRERNRTDSLEELQEFKGFEPLHSDSSRPSPLDCELSLAVHRRAFEAIRAAAKDPGRFAVLSRFIPVEGEDASYATAAAELKVNPGAIRTAVHRLREEYFEQFRSEVMQMTRPGGADVDDETRYLLEILFPTLERLRHPH